MPYDHVITSIKWSPNGDFFAVGSFEIGLHAGAFAGLTITANILMSLVIDKYGMFGMQTHELSWQRRLGGGLMVAGILLINRF